MEKESYIVSFRAGSSGRFVANLLWGLIKPSNHNYNLSEYNSTHAFSPYAISFEVSTPTEFRPFNNPDIYKHLNFKNYPGVATVHVYPDFDTINAKFPDTKIVIISFERKDIPEISGNSLLKNGFEKLKSLDYKPGTDHCTSFIYNQYLLEFNQPYTGQEIPLDFKKELFKRYQHGFSIDTIMSGFLSPTIPDIDIERTLIINYHDLCHLPDCTLEKLSQFTNSSINEQVIELYQQYLLGRESSIKKHMPWINL